MTSLQNLCYESIAETIYHAPPQIQDFIIGETTDRIEKRIEENVLENNINLFTDLENITPFIISDMINAMANNSLRTNYYARFSYVRKEIISSAINIAENTLNSLPEHYITRVFDQNNLSFDYYDIDSE